jgi:lactoylglutathione lyase
MIPIEAIFETHLTVTDLDRSVAFYRDVLGLKLAIHLPDRHVAFFWVGPQGTSMLGLWSVGSVPLRMSLHTAFRVQPADVIAAFRLLEAAGILPLDLAGRPTSEPVVLCWMPAVAIYFHDPDGNLLEFIAMLNDVPRSETGVLSWSEWQRLRSLPNPG